MEKLIYLLHKPENITCAHWKEQLLKCIPPSLRSAGASNFRLNLADDDVAGANAMRMTSQPPLPDALLSFWVSSAANRRAIEICLATLAASVCSGLMIPDTLMGSKLLPDTEVLHNDQQKKLFHRVQARDGLSGAGSGLQHTGSL